MPWIYRSVQRKNIRKRFLRGCYVEGGMKKSPFSTNISRYLDTMEDE